MTTDSRHNLLVAPNLLNRKFAVTSQDVVYCSDINYIWTRESWLYLTVVLDLSSRKVVGWSMSKRIAKALVSNALQMAIWYRRPGTVLIFQSDRSSQYCSNSLQKLLRKNQMKSSMSRGKRRLREVIAGKTALQKGILKILEYLVNYL